MSAAAAQIAAHALLQLLSRENDIARQVGADEARYPALGLRSHADRRANLPGRAIAALEPVMIDERLLQRVQTASFGQSFDRGDLPTLMLHGQGKARQDTFAVDQHRAGAARALVAALLGAGEVEMISQQVQ